MLKGEKMLNGIEKMLNGVVSASPDFLYALVAVRPIARGRAL